MQEKNRNIETPPGGATALLSKLGIKEPCYCLYTHFEAG